MNNDRIKRAFTYHPPKPGQPERYVRIRDIAKEYAEEITRLCPQTYERDFALAKLEECVMWANASIARNE